MEKHKKVISKYRRSLMRKKNVIGVGYGKKEKKGRLTEEDAIVVLVNKKISSQKLNNKDIVPMSVDDYRTDVIETGDIQLLDMRTDKIRPVRPGVSIGHYKISAGTLGAVVRDNKSDNPLLLSNNHVLANITNGRDNRAEIGDPILQPGTYDSGSRPEDVIGHLERYVPLRRKNDETDCPVASAIESLTNSFLHMLRPDYNFKIYKKGVENKVDCAVAKPVSNDSIDNSILEVGKVKGIKEAEVGMTVQKSGRTSGLTESKIKIVSTTIEVKVSQNEVAVFEDQILTEPMSKPGDSGSLVLDKDNNAVGLLFAGSERATVCNRITNVMEALDIKF